MYIFALVHQIKANKTFSVLHEKINNSYIVGCCWSGVVHPYYIHRSLQRECHP